ncbi:MAG: hypothetical protein P0S93_06405 [Candidatus Neptunochlamydia sp.]|nr:hypothetical protein [Candidatus Neptunochlamydia sp.]
MRSIFALIISLLVFLTGCGSQTKGNQERMTNIHIVDRNGFKETISSLDRLATYEKTNFLTPQPYDKVVRMFARNENGKTPAKLTTYHENGEPWQYLEVMNGRAFGIYREWHSNGVLRLDVRVIEGLGDLSEEAQLGWVFDGVSRAWNESGILIAEINYEKGSLQGNANYYHTNGHASKVIPYENNLIDGELIYYNKQGKVVGKTPYKKGKREGIATYKGDQAEPSYSEEYRDDLLIQATYHDFSGKIIKKIEKGYGKQPIYINGSLHCIREYRNGIPEGEVKLFDSHGYLKTLFHVKDGIKHGEEWVYYPALGNQEPKPKLYMEWYEDAIHGICRSWYSDGVLESEREIINNQKHGIASAWYKDGSLMLIEDYEKDQLQKGTYMKKGEFHPVSSIENGEGTATLFDKDGYFLKRVLYQKGLVVDEL